MNGDTTDAILIGGGLAGLACAVALHDAGRTVTILEASDGVGGRVRTDVTPDGFRLDRGFQVYLTAYPEGRRLLDHDALDLKPFTPGALVRHGGKFHRLSDPLRRPQHLLQTALNPLVAWGDVYRVLRLRASVGRGEPEDLYDRPQTTTDAELKSRGFSADLIESFFRPFLAGVFLERELTTSSRFFEFTFRMFAGGETAVPAMGIGAIPQQLAARLPAGSIRLNASVASVDPGRVTLATGETLTATDVVVATDGPTASQLLGDRLTHPRPGPPVGCTTLYYAAEKSPVGEPTLVLNGDGPTAGPVNNLVVMSDAAPAYAPPGAALVSASVVGVPTADDPTLDAQVRDHLADWYGRKTVDAWRLLRIDRIPYSLPPDGVEALATPRRPTKLADGLHACGDHRAVGSQNGAMLSGRLAAEAILGRGLIPSRHVAPRPHHDQPRPVRRPPVHSGNAHPREGRARPARRGRAGVGGSRGLPVPRFGGHPGRARVRGRRDRPRRPAQRLTGICPRLTQLVAGRARAGNDWRRNGFPSTSHERRRMTQKDFFERLGAPLNSVRQSWGAARESDGTIFLRVWQKGVTKRDGRLFVEVMSSQWHRAGDAEKYGHRERRGHVERIAAGAPCYLVMCEMADDDSPGARVKSFDSDDLFRGGEVVEHEGEWRIEMAQRVPARQVMPD